MVPVLGFNLSNFFGLVLTSGVGVSIEVDNPFFSVEIEFWDIAPGLPEELIANSALLAGKITQGVLLRDLPLGSSKACA